MPPEGDARFLTKFAFRIRARSGTPVDNLLVQAADRAQAERRINQMYPYCEIIECRELTATPRDETASLDSILSIIARDDPAPR
jgi:hypothetical protein